MVRNIETAAGRRKSLLGIIASPRKLGNCELFVKAVSEQLPFEHNLELIRLSSLTILPCKGCSRCLGGPCPLQDDLPLLHDPIVSSDAIIVAPPVYMLGTHGSMKNLIDRIFSFYQIPNGTRGKPCGLVNMHGMKEGAGASSQALLAFASFLGLDVKSSLGLRAALPGDVLGRHGMRAASGAARSLFTKDGETIFPSPEGCPFCGNEIVRLQRDGLLCTLCRGSFSIDRAENRVKKPGWSVWDVRHVHRHHQWLLGMKRRFLLKKKELLRQSLPYKDRGRWIEPAGRNEREVG